MVDTFVVKRCWRKRRGQVVSALGLNAVALGSIPVLAPGLDLFTVVPYPTLPRFVNSQLVASCKLEFLKGLGHAILGNLSTDRMVIELTKISK